MAKDGLGAKPKKECPAHAKSVAKANKRVKTRLYKKSFLFMKKEIPYEAESAASAMRTRFKNTPSIKIN